MLAGTYNGGTLPNLAPLPCYYESGVINYNLGAPGASIGNITGDKPFPGYPDNGTLLDNLAIESLSYLELRKGAYRLVVNSDDGFRLRSSLGVTDPNYVTALGEFNGGRGSADSFADIFVTEDGLYPMRLTFEEGQGGANLEFYSVNYDISPTTFVAINDAGGGIPSYRVPVSGAGPGMSIVQSGGNYVISWPAGAAGFCLQCAPSLTAPITWADVSGVVQTQGATRSVTVPAQTSNRFYRLLRR